MVTFQYIVLSPRVYSRGFFFAKKKDQSQKSKPKPIAKYKTET
jgi:hypothetical protein